MMAATRGMRVLMTTDAIGGVWQYSTELAAALARCGIETMLAIMGPAPGAAERRHAQSIAGVTLIDTGLPLDWLCSSEAPVVAAGAAIAALAGRTGVDIVHLNMPTLAAGTRFPVPVVAVAHGCIATWWQAANLTPLDGRYRWQQSMMREGFAAADAVVAPSAAYAATVARTYDLAALPVVVHNGRSPLTVPGATVPAPGVLTVGRLWDQVKNTALLDRVASRIEQPFYAAGALHGPHGETARPQHLLPLGHLDAAQMGRALAGAPVFVSAARFEPFGLAVLEAAAAGCPLVLSKIDTFRELWDGAALFVDEDERAYAEAIGRIVADAGLRAELGDAARVRAARYTPEATAASMATLYGRVAGGTVTNRTVPARKAAMRRVAA